MGSPTAMGRVQCVRVDEGWRQAGLDAALKYSQDLLKIRGGA